MSYHAWNGASASIRVRGATLAMLASYLASWPTSCRAPTASTEWQDALRLNVLFEQWPGRSYTAALHAAPDHGYIQNVGVLFHISQTFSGWWEAACAQLGAESDCYSHSRSTRRAMVGLMIATWMTLPTPVDVDGQESDFQDSLDDAFSSVVTTRLADAWAREADNDEQP